MSVTVIMADVRAPAPTTLAPSAAVAQKGNISAMMASLVLVCMSATKIFNLRLFSMSYHAMLKILG